MYCAAADGASIDSRRALDADGAVQKMRYLPPPKKNSLFVKINRPFMKINRPFMKTNRLFVKRNVGEIFRSRYV